MTTIEEVAGWLRELAKWYWTIAHMSGMTCTNELNLKRAKLWEDRASQVEAMGWRPIEDAPKDATFVDLWNSSLKVRMTDCLWSKGCWRKWDEVDQEYVAVADGSTHFMLPPQPPVNK